MTNLLLDIGNVSHQYRIRRGFRRRLVRAVEKVSLQIQTGETLGLVGESGSGKSTLGRILVRLIEPSQGRLRFREKDVTHLDRNELRDFRREVQMIFQDPYSSLNPRMSVYDIIAEPLRNFEIARGRQADRRIKDILEVCGLGVDASSRYPHELSGGQRQRVGIARALVIQPSLIVCDEPVSALDVSIQAQIINLLVDLRREFNLTCVFIAHDLALVKYISNRVAVMYLGHIVEIATTDQIYQAPGHPYTKVLLSSIPLTDPALERLRRPIPLRGEIPSAIHPPKGCRFHTRCPWAQFPTCRELEPQLIEVAPGHQVACHFSGSVSNQVIPQCLLSR